MCPITLRCMDFANEIAPGVSKGILLAKHESVFKNFPFTDYRSLFGFKKFKMVESIWWSSKSDKFYKLRPPYSMRHFEFSHLKNSIVYSFSFRFNKLKMADRIWWSSKSVNLDHHMGCAILNLQI